jgi:hypothetical protein
MLILNPAVLPALSLLIRIKIKIIGLLGEIINRQPKSQPIIAHSLVILCAIE